MKFSVIVVTLNAGERLLETVNSALSQTYKDFELLVKDGESSDGSLDFLGGINDSRIRVVSRKDASIYDAMNQAVTDALGEYYIFMNTGDLFASDKVLAAVAKHLVSNKADIVYGDMIRKGQNTVVPYPCKLTDFGLYRNVPCHQVCFYHNRLFDGRAYNLRLKVRSDYEHFLWSVYRANAITSHIDMPICIYEGGGFSETSANLKRSKKEHTMIVKEYQGNKAKLFDLIMIITLQPLRQKISENSVLGGIYQKIKGLIYGRK